MEKWIPAQSPARPHSPSRASTSLTSWPFPTPPRDGLQDRAPGGRRWEKQRALFGTCAPWSQEKISLGANCLFNEALPLTDGLYSLCDQERVSSHSGCRRRRLGPCMAPAHNNDIIPLSGEVTGTPGNQHQETLQGGKLLCQHV